MWVAFRIPHSAFRIPHSAFRIPHSAFRIPHFVQGLRSQKASLRLQTFMKRRWNLALWAGFVFAFAGLMSYVPFFILFPITRDFPWANLLLFGVGAVLLAVGLARAYRQPQLYRGRVAGPILAALSLAGFSLFAYGLLYKARQVPASLAAPHVGQKAPEFTLLDADGKSVALAELLSSPAGGLANGKVNGVLLIFYRGYW
jgi:hypothetical protein